MQLPILCLFLLGIQFAWACRDRELVFVQAIWRHGDRAPKRLPYPYDLYKENAWPRGWNQLTNLGMRQMNELGRFMKRRYRCFVSDIFRSAEVKILSSNIDRAICSAQSFLSGFYPPSGGMRFFPRLAWQPIPVHTIGDGLPDPLLHSSSIECPAYKKLVGADKEQLAARANRTYAKLFRFLEKKTGILPFGYKNVNKIYDINRELWNGLRAKQPSWLNVRWREYGGLTTLQIASELRRQSFEAEFNTVEKSRYRAGYLLRQWVLNAVTASNMTTGKTHKMLLYSSHDRMVKSLMSVLGVSEKGMIPYAAALILEVIRERSEYYVQMFYRRGPGTRLIHLPIPRCGRRCRVDDFVRLYQGTFIDSLEQMNQMCTASKPKTAPLPSTEKRSRNNED